MKLMCFMKHDRYNLKVTECINVSKLVFVALSILAHCKPIQMHLRTRFYY